MLKKQLIRTNINKFRGNKFGNKQTTKIEVVVWKPHQLDNLFFGVGGVSATGKFKLEGLILFEICSLRSRRRRRHRCRRHRYALGSFAKVLC